MKSSHSLVLYLTNIVKLKLDSILSIAQFRITGKNKDTNPSESFITKIFFSYIKHDQKKKGNESAMLSKD